MIYEPQEDSYLLLEYVDKLAFGKVLDMGTGTGILALKAVDKKEVKEVVAVDTDEQAVNELKKKDIDKLKVFHSDLFSNIKERFNVIVFNPPYLPEDKKDKDSALDGGKKGYEVIERFLREAKKYLNNKGFILMMFSNKTGRQEIDNIIKREGCTYELLEKKSLAFFEELFVYKIKIK